MRRNKAAHQRTLAGMEVPSDVFGGKSPEHKAAEALQTFFTYCAVKVRAANECYCLVVIAVQAWSLTCAQLQPLPGTAHLYIPPAPVALVANCSS